MHEGPPSWGGWINVGDLQAEPGFSRPFRISLPEEPTASSSHTRSASSLKSPAKSTGAPGVSPTAPQAAAN